MGSALELVLVLDAILTHFGTYHLPGFAEDAEVPHELVVELEVPEILSLLVILEGLLGCGVLLLLAGCHCWLLGDEVLVVIRMV